MPTDGEIAQRYLERGFPEAAYVWANQSTEHSASRYSVLGTSTLLCFGIRKIDDAIKAYTKAIKLNPSDFSIKLLRGGAYLMKAEDLRNSYLGRQTGRPQRSPEIEEMITDAVQCAERDFFSVFRFSRSPASRTHVAKKFGELNYIKESMGNAQ